MTKEDAGEQIEEARLDRGWTIGDLQRESGVAKSFLSELERGMKSPTVATLRKIAKALGIHPRDLL